MPKPTCKSSKKKTPEKPRFCKRYKNIEDMPVINRHAAGIDLGGDVSHFVAVEAGDEVEVKEFGGMTPDLRALVEYLKTYGVTTAAMEATGVYWVPVYRFCKEQLHSVEQHSHQSVHPDHLERLL